MGVSKVFQFPSEDFCSREENEIAPPPTNVYASLASLQLVKRSSSDVTWNTDGIYAAAHHRNYSYSFAKHLPDRRSSTWGAHNRVSARSGRETAGDGVAALSRGEPLSPFQDDVLSQEAPVKSGLDKGGLICGVLCSVAKQIFSRLAGARPPARHNALHKLKLSDISCPRAGHYLVHTLRPVAPLS
jgi:hypothetical protein